jgi:putative CRISPR-associated protein (TIGR02619 family)
MRNLLFVTVGTSALDAPRRILTSEPSRKAEVEDLARRVREFKGGKGSDKDAADPLFSPLLELQLGFWARPEISWEDTEQIRETSAELLTTAVLLRKLAHDADLLVHKIILLIPDNPEAKLAGEVVKAVMESREYKAHSQAPQVVTRTLPDIKEKEAMQALPSALLSAVSENRDLETDRIMFNATAGYGAMLILIGMLALRYGFRVYYQHEKMPSPMFISQNIHIGWDARTWILS